MRQKSYLNITSTNVDARSAILHSRINPYYDHSRWLMFHRRLTIGARWVFSPWREMYEECLIKITIIWAFRVVVIRPWWINYLLQSMSLITELHQSSPSPPLILNHFSIFLVLLSSLPLLFDNKDETWRGSCRESFCGTELLGLVLVEEKFVCVESGGCVTDYPCRIFVDVNFNTAYANR